MGLGGLTSSSGGRRKGDRTMIVQCEQCMAKYRLDDSRISGEKSKVKCSRCQHIFMVSKETPPQEEPTVQLHLEEQHEKVTQDLFQCPNCGFQQPHSQDCIKCGIVFSKFQQSPDPMPSPNAQYPEVYGQGGDLFQEQAEESPMVYAGFWSRFVAYVIDGVVVGIIEVITLMVTVGPTWLVMLRYLSQNHMTGNPQLGAFPASLPLALYLGVLLSVVLPVLYFIIMWGRKGATLGKMAMGIRVVRTNGSNISYGTAFLRYIGYQFISPALFLLGFLWMLWDDRKQTWHDKIASTCVIRTQ